MTSTARALRARYQCCRALAALLLLLSARRASAEEAERPEYRETVDAAVAAFEAHDLEEARSLFARADAMFPNARTQRGLGLSEFELRNYVKSIDHLQAALRSEVRPLEGELRRHTSECRSG